MGQGSRAEKRFELAERRRQAWSEGDRAAVHDLTRKLNGHALDVYWDRPAKSSYFGDDGGAWGDHRKQRAKESPADTRDGYDAALWGGNPEHVLSEVWAGSDAWDAQRAQAIDLVSPQHAEDGPDTEVGYIAPAHELSGGDHDLAWLVFYGLRSYELEEYRDALGRRGRLPVHLKPVKDDGERLIRGLNERGVSHTTTAQIFGVSEKTVRRTLERPNVRSYPIDADTEVATREDVRLMEGRLAESLNSIQSAVNAILLRSDDVPADAPLYD